MSGHGFHAGEVEVQRRAGVREMAERIGNGIRAPVPEPARRFLEEQPMVVLAAADAAGRPWASILTGPPGFASAPSPETVRIASRPVAGDPLGEGLVAGAHAGMVVIDFATRRRLRVNGRIGRIDDDGIEIRTDQVYSNCPKYIQARTAADHAPPLHASRAAARSSGLSDAQRAWIRRADTFFIATANPAEGVDASHRGGMPGFVRVQGNDLAWPDYRGNSMFNTLGNIAVHPRAGLVFPDFESGAMLLLTGAAAIDWDPSHAAAVPGAERLVTVTVEEVVEIDGALPQRLIVRDYSPFNPPAALRADG